MKNRASLVAVVVVLAVFCGSAWAIPGWGPEWTNANGTGIWNDPLNWDEGYIPTTNDMVVMRHANNVCRIEAPAVCRATAGPGHDVASIESHLDIIPGGSLAVTTTNWSEGLTVGYLGYGSVNMYGGSCDVETVETKLGGEPGSYGRLLMQNGYFRSGGSLALNRYDIGGKARVFAYGGLIDAGWMVMNGDALIDITYGAIEVRADMYSQVESWVDANMITAFGGTGEVLYDYGQTKAGVTTITAIVPEPATPALLGLGGLVLRRMRRH